MTKKVPQKAKILLYDIETAPNLAYVWGKYEQNVISYEEEWYMLSFAYKWFGEKQTHVKALCDFKGYRRGAMDDKELVKALHELFNEADVVIAHNGDQFDQKKSNARFIYHGLTPPRPYRQIDTKKVAKKYFRFNSNKLDDIGQLLKLGKKLPTGGFDLWLGCMAGEQKAWQTMKKYNVQDVILLEKVYLKMRGWIGNHPSMALLNDTMDACPNCGADKKHIVKNGSYHNRVTKVQVWGCRQCGAHPRSRMVEPSKKRVELVSA